MNISDVTGHLENIVGISSISKNGVTTYFTYDGNGSRVKKVGSSTTLYFGELYEDRGGVRVFHVFAGNIRIASLRSDGKDQYYHGNHLNSASVITNEAGVKKQKIEYYPFGTYRSTGDSAGTWDYDSSFPNANYTFTDQESDDEFGFYNYKARLYDPTIGRFISPDSVVPEPGDLQTFNRYSYCVNNPLVYLDPSGHIFGIDDAIIIAVVVIMAEAAAVGAVAGAAVAAVNGGNILQGALTGAISGALVAGFGIVGGAMAGVINASITGGDLGQGALYGAIAAAGGLANMGVGAMGLEGFAQAGVSMVAGGLVSGGITALAGGNFGQGFVNGVAGAAAGYFASIGMTKILQDSPTNTSPQENEQRASYSLASEPKTWLEAMRERYSDYGEVEPASSWNSNREAELKAYANYGAKQLSGTPAAAACGKAVAFGVAPVAAGIVGFMEAGPGGAMGAFMATAAVSWPLAALFYRECVHN